jgi:hypothetical protein
MANNNPDLEYILNVFAQHLIWLETKTCLLLLLSLDLICYGLNVTALLSLHLPEMKDNQCLFVGFENGVFPAQEDGLHLLEV